MTPSLVARCLCLCALSAVLACEHVENEGPLPLRFASDLAPGDFGPTEPEKEVEGAGDDGDGDGTEEGDEQGDATSPAPERLIREADLVRIDGDRLYVVSRASGLHIIDVSNPERLVWLGRHHFASKHAVPLEMYLRYGVALVLYTNEVPYTWGQYVQNPAGDGYFYDEGSKLLAIDVSQPSAPMLLGSFDVPGKISDSRLVGDILYTVTYQEGGCWGCARELAATSVISMNVADPRAIRQVDELSFEDETNIRGPGPRSVSLNDQRLYVAGVERNVWGTTNSSITVVDISDPGGKLLLGATVEVDGAIESRWQMDEYEGVLRVVSQALTGDASRPPVVETFQVNSAQELVPLGRLAMALPRPEQLRSVRFDGPRAYAITVPFERSDPLFTLDLSNPAAPAQRGQLEIPGFVYHMEPRGDRLIGLGFEEGGLALSLFDVSDLSQPSLLARVKFGGNQAELPEAQNRIHKAFRVFDELGLIVVPYGSQQVSLGCGSNLNGGVQLVDLSPNMLTLRASVPVRGEALRAFVHAGRLLTISDEAVANYDISDRGQPRPLASLPVAHPIERAISLANGHVARLWSRPGVGVSLDVVPAESAASPVSGPSELLLHEAISPLDCADGVKIREVVARGNLLFVWFEGPGASRGVHGCLSVDASDPAAPKLLDRIAWHAHHVWARDSSQTTPEKQVLLAGDTLAKLETTRQEPSDPNLPRSEGFLLSWLRLVDIRDPAQLSTSVLSLPRRPLGYGPLLADGTLVLTSHSEPSAEQPGMAHFFADRFDLADPSAPRTLPPINVPGTPLHFSAQASRILTIDLTRVGGEHLTSGDCGLRYAIHSWTEGGCVGYRQHVNFLSLHGDQAELLNRREIDERVGLHVTSVDDDVLFATALQGVEQEYRGACQAGPCIPAGPVAAQVFTFGGLKGDTLKVGSLDVENTGWWRFHANPFVAAARKRALVVGANDAVVVDASDPEHPRVAQRIPVGAVEDVRIDRSGGAWIAQGAQGLEHVVMGGP